jgi:predicted DsbA family dithiol-disulfide isomerase
MLTPPVSSRDHVLGPPDAPIVIVEYGDFECPFCAQAEPVLKGLRRSLQTILLFAFRHSPLAEAHPHALHAAEAAEAAGAQGKFWPMHDYLFAHQDALEDSDLVEYAAAVGCDVDRFIRAMAENRYLPRVREDFLSGIAAASTVLRQSSSTESATTALVTLTRCLPRSSEWQPKKTRDMPGEK